MQVVVPMSGLGSRFVEAGYSEIKPLIKVNGRPMIEWVCDLFPGNHDFIFICRSEHLEHTKLHKELKRIKPGGVIVEIEGHRKGPVYAVSQAWEKIDPQKPLLINYCDFFMNWDFSDFCNSVKNQNWKGAIPCYTGFHPHLIPKENKYAVCKEEDGVLTDIEEKHRYHEDPFMNNHSAGTYYFSSGDYAKQVYEEMLKREDLALNGEYYSSLAYKISLERGDKILVYKKITHFCQWGTPADLEEFNRWGKIIQHYQAYL